MLTLQSHGQIQKEAIQKTERQLPRKIHEVRRSSWIYAAGPAGRVKYVGITKNPRRRASEHGRSGKRGKLRVETGPLSRKGARRWEGARLAGHRKKTGGKNPRYNKTRDGGYRRRSKGWW